MSDEIFYLDDDGITRNPVKLAVEVTVKGDSVEFDFSGSDSQTAGPLNCTYFTTCSAVVASSMRL